MLVVCSWLLAKGLWSLAAGYWQPVGTESGPTCCWLLIICRAGQVPAGMFKGLDLISEFIRPGARNQLPETRDELPLASDELPVASDKESVTRDQPP